MSFMHLFDDFSSTGEYCFALSTKQRDGYEMSLAMRTSVPMEKPNGTVL